ncbi:MAG: hypothetical protein ACO2Y5_04970 [Nitrosopumilaceae archaeon]
MARCKRCGREMENKREGFCSLSCYNLDLQEKISSMGNANSMIKKNTF